MSNVFTATVYGEPASKANSRSLVAFGGKPRFVKSQKALEYKKAFEKLADMKANIAKDFITPEVAETDKEETKTDEQS